MSLPFSTTLARLSPVTRNHKIAHIEAEIIIDDNTDNIGRLYLRQAGTSVIMSVDGTPLRYRFPERLAVLDPFFNGTRVFAPEVYRNERLRDLPFVNTHWQLLFNQVDEVHNQDIDLNKITDILLLVYYTDFTAP